MINAKMCNNFNALEDISKVYKVFEDEKFRIITKSSSIYVEYIVFPFNIKLWFKGNGNIDICLFGFRKEYVKEYIHFDYLSTHDFYNKIMALYDKAAEKLLEEINSKDQDLLSWAAEYKKKKEELEILYNYIKKSR